MFKLRLIEVAVCIWIISCVYCWWVLEGSPELFLVLKYLGFDFPELESFFRKSKDLLWPYIYRKYVF